MQVKEYLENLVNSKRGSDKHSDLYTDENPKGTIHGLGFTDGEKSVKTICKQNKKFW